MPLCTADTPEGLEEGRYYRIVNGACFKLVKNNASFNPETGEVDGVLTIQFLDEDNTVVFDADEIHAPLSEGAVIGADELYDYLIEGDLFELSDRQLTDSEGIIREFAESELDDYLSNLSPSHPFNAIDGVERVFDILIALDLLDITPVGGTHNISSIGDDRHGTYYQMDDNAPIEGVTLNEADGTVTIHD